LQSLCGEDPVCVPRERRTFENLMGRKWVNFRHPL